MSAEQSLDPPAGVTHLVARLLAAARRAEARLDAVIAEVRQDEALRPDDESRAAVAGMLEAAVLATGQAIAAYAARVLTRDRATAPSLGAPTQVYARLARDGHLSDRALLRAIWTEARLSVIEPALVATRAPEDTPLLLPRLADHRDPVVRDRATAFLLADARHRRDGDQAPELPAEVEHRLAWLVAATLASDDAAVDRAVIEATLRHLAARDEDRQSGAAAVRLAAALDVGPDDLAATLVDALIEGRLRLFAAFLATATGLDLAEAGAVTIDPDPVAMLTALRAAGLARDELAHIGLRLAHADRARDLEALADEVDAAGALDVEEARAAIAPLTLDPDFRAARRELARSA